MLAFSEILKSFSPIKNLKSNVTSVKKFIFEKFFDLVLIVISIYIALNVEKIAEHGNDREKLRQYYENIEKELNKDISSLDTCRIKTQAGMANELRLLRQLKDYSRAIDDTITAFMGGAITLQMFASSDMLSYKSMVVSGDIKLIKNLKVKEKFIALDSKYNTIKIYEDYMLEFLKKDFTPMMNENFDLMNNTKLMNPKLYADYRFRNLIVMFYSLNVTRVNAYIEALNTARETRELLRQELEK